jgi:hypothetical protein
LLVEKVVYDKMEKQLGIELQEERNRRIAAEAAKRKTDSEVEALTAALFEEANVVRKTGPDAPAKLTNSRWLLLHAKKPKPQRSVGSTSSNKSPTPKYSNIPSRSNCRTSRASWRR